MAKVYLDSGDNFTLSSAATVYGSTGTEKVVVNSGVTGVTIDASVERVDLSGASSAYTFKQAGNTIQVYSGTTLVATTTVQDDTNGSQLVFSNGSVDVKMATGGTMTLGGATVSSTAAGAVTPTTIDTATTSGSGSGGSGGGSTAGQTFSLTTGIDNLTGTVGNDTFKSGVSATAADNTLGLLDNLDGGAGTDTLDVIVSVAAADIAVPTAGISNIETVNIRALSSDGVVSNAATFASVKGVSTVNAYRSNEAVTITNLDAGATVGVIGDESVTQTTTSFAYAATGSASIAISGGTKAGNITNTGASSASNTVSSSGVANTVGTIDLGTGTNVTGLTINAATDLTASLAADYAANAKVTVTGAGKVTLSGAALSASIAEVDASAQTAGGTLVLVNQGDTTVDTKFVGGAGNDTLDVGAVVYNSVSITGAGGNGTDTLRMSDQAALTSTTVKYLTGFETLSLYDDNDGALDTFDASLMGATAVVLAADSAADGYSVTNMSSTAAANVKITGTQAVAPTFGVKDASVVGNLDTLSITIDDLAAATVAATTITLADVTAAGVETINFAMTDHLTVSAATGLTAMTKVGFTGAGNLSFTTGALVLNVNSTLDASAATGTVLIDASAATTNGLAIKGSATKANTITGTNQNDAVTGGTGVDTFKNQADAATDSDTLNFVSDSSADIFEVTTVTGKTTVTNFDAATATTAEDLINVSNNSVDGAEVEITAAGGAAVIGNDKTYVVKQTIGGAGALATGGTATLVEADFTAATLTNVATYLSERFTGDNDTNADEAALIIVNNGTNSYAYAYQDSTTANTTIDAGELVLIGVFNSAIIGAEDVYQTV